MEFIITIGKLQKSLISIFIILLLTSTIVYTVSEFVPLEHPLKWLKFFYLSLFDISLSLMDFSI
uniref:Ion transport domain-containing protein n=1 Tax=Ascaris lumbricoides TaxID=6252 RepID=A0A0M3IMT3_ASCLU